MTPDPATARELGQIAAELRQLREGQERIFTRLDEMAVNGCAVGREHGRMIGEIKAAPGRLVSMGAGMVAILAAVAAWVARLK